jgi:hypothetical protein
MPSPSPLEPADPLLEVIDHLGAALMQADASDDQIILDHVHAAHALALARHRTDRLAAAGGRPFVPSIVPSDQDQTVYLVLDDFGHAGRAFREADPARSDRASTIGDLMSGQYRNPVSVIAINLPAQWASDVSKDIARDIRRRADLAGEAVPDAIAEFVEDHVGWDGQLTLRLA